jgi:hypothetical protein
MCGLYRLSRRKQIIAAPWLNSFTSPSLEHLKQKIGEHMKRRLIFFSVICGLIFWIVSFGIDLLFERLFPSSPLLEDLFGDLITGVAAGAACYLYKTYRIRRRAWYDSFASINDEIRNTLQVLVLLPDDEFMRALPPTIDRIDSIMRRNAPPKAA